MEQIQVSENLNNNFTQLIQKKLVQLEKIFRIKISIRGNKIMFDGLTRDKALFEQFVRSIQSIALEKNFFSHDDFILSLNMFQESQTTPMKEEILNNPAIITINGTTVHPKTLNQKKYMMSIKNNDLIFAIGPAGTGKTFLAIALALNSLFKKKVNRIVLTRPVVEAGESLGYLPGDIKQKVNPYFRPVYDSLYNLIGFEKTSDLIEKEIIEIAPLAYMRGRTIDNSFIILDEGQNTVNSQMKMFLTRFGQNSKVIITADTSQIDLPQNKNSGIFTALKILKNIEGIAMIKLTEQDIIRHNLVQKIINAYNKAVKTRSK
jgi:phosphate starvation-inducible PhoH-like protein